MTGPPPLLAVTQGDPAGIGPELLLRLIAEPPEPERWRGLLVAERAALEAVAGSFPGGLEALAELRWIESAEAAPPTGWSALDPVRSRRRVDLGVPSASDAKGALAALDTAIESARSGAVDAIVTAPVGKEAIAHHVLPDFRGHTDYLARACGLERYGRDYLMTFLAPELRVALLSAHLPLREAIEGLSTDRVVEALGCLHRHSGGRIALAGLNPHAGEGGLLGSEEEEILEPAVERVRGEGIDVYGPEAPDSLFARARGGEFDWVLALYHDQGLIAVKTAAFGKSVNWTLGLPFVRTSVDHGTAYPIAGRGLADPEPLKNAVRRTLDLLRARRPN